MWPVMIICYILRIFECSYELLRVLMIDCWPESAHTFHERVGMVPDEAEHMHTASTAIIDHTLTMSCKFVLTFSRYAPPIISVQAWQQAHLTAYATSTLNIRLQQLIQVVHCSTLPGTLPPACWSVWNADAVFYKVHTAGRCCIR